MDEGLANYTGERKVGYKQRLRLGTLPSEKSVQRERKYPTKIISSDRFCGSPISRMSVIKILTAKLALLDFGDGSGM